jgi:hypothetical protein
MLRFYFAIFAALLTGSSAAVAATADTPPFVPGRTTVAQVEQGLGAPIDTSMQPDGALTLVYPAMRLPGLAYGRNAAGRTVTLYFGPDFVLRDETITRAGLLTRDGFASR